MNISVFGLGKLGSVLAVLLSSNGHKVYGVDRDRQLINDFSKGISPHNEPNLQDLLNSSRKNFTATLDSRTSVLNSDLSILIVPTPSDESGAFSNEYLLTAIKEIGGILKEKETNHLIVISSTVMPLTCDQVIISTLEQSSGKKIGQGLGLIYSPVFIALGSVIHDMQYPDIILIGESDKISGDIYEKIARSLVLNNPVTQRMSLVNAELVKIAVNTFVTTKISFANLLSEICDRLPNSDVDVVTAAVGNDSRIGKSYFKGALGYGGPCFPRDNIALTRLADSLGIVATIPAATDEINKRQASRILEIINSLDLEEKTVAVLGLAYKPDTPVIEESQGILIANLLDNQGLAVYVHDPLALKNAEEHLNPSIKLSGDLNQVILGAQLLILATPWQEYLNLDVNLLNHKVIIDCWRVLSKEDFPNVKLIYPGRLNLESSV